MYFINISEILLTAAHRSKVPCWQCRHTRKIYNFLLSNERENVDFRCSFRKNLSFDIEKILIYS